MSRYRKGFTLVELLMVIVVLTVLSSLLYVASMSVISSSREAQTKSIVHRAKRVIQDRMSDFEQQRHAVFDAHEWGYIKGRLKQKAGTDPVMVAIFQGISNRIAAAVPTEKGREADVLALIETERISFPQTWSEAEWMLHSVGESITWTVNPETENSEVLYWFISRSESTEAESLPSVSHRDTDGNGREELLDSWGGMVRFWRWPTRLNDTPELAKLRFPTAEAKDPHNPLNVLDGIIVEPEYYAKKLYHTPLVVSPGPDGRHGMGNPADKSTLGYWGKVVVKSDFFDDIISD